MRELGIEPATSVFNPGSMAFDLQILTVIYIYIFFNIFDQSFNFCILCGELTVCSNIGIVECLFSPAQAAVSKHYN